MRGFAFAETSCRGPKFAQVTYALIFCFAQDLLVRWPAVRSGLLQLRILYQASSIFGGPLLMQEQTTISVIGESFVPPHWRIGSCRSLCRVRSQASWFHIKLSMLHVRTYSRRFAVEAARTDSMGKCISSTHEDTGWLLGVGSSNLCCRSRSVLKSGRTHGRVHA